MANKYIVANKWTTSNTNSPGYISGFEINKIVEICKKYPDDVQHINAVLESNKINSEYFDLTVYQNYAEAALAVRSLGEIQFFAVAKFSNMLSFSILVFNSHEDDIFLNNTTDSTIQNMFTARDAYMSLTNLECETRKGYKDLTTDTLIKMYERQPLALNEVRAIFDSF